METSGTRRSKLFGRRKGPKLSQHQSSLIQTLLPRLALNLAEGRDPRSYFEDAIDNVWLEVGFGGGEHLLWQAQHHPDVGLIGAEPYETGVAKLLSKIDSLDAQYHPPLGGGRGCLNLRVYQGDARDIIEALPDASLGRVFILFPDPWPKTRHHKRRFIQTGMLDALARVMKPAAELRFASDDSPYVGWTLERLLAHPAFDWTAAGPDDWKTRPADWPPTRYEEKALHGVPAFLTFVRI